MSLFSRTRSSRVLGFLAAGLLLMGQTMVASVAQENRSIDLRLFGKNVIEEYDGCQIGFWQADKNPSSDKYAYVFFAPFNDGEELPAWMKIGKTVFELQREDKAQVEGQKIEALRLYRTSKGTFTAVIEVIDQHVENSNILVDKGRIILTRKKHNPFVINVKGGIICPQVSPSNNDAAGPSEALHGDPIQLGKSVEFDSLAAVPRGILDTLKRDAPDCSPNDTAGFGARYAISDAMTLWEVPCNMYARTGSSVYVTALNDNPNHSSVLILPSVPDHGDSYGQYELRAPHVNTRNAIVTSEYYDGDGSCGSYESYQLRAVEGEALEFFLIEYREKPSCDGVQGDARNFPLIYSAH